MMRAKVVISPTREAPTARISKITPKHELDFKKCRTNFHIGLFFDGTNNNIQYDRPKLSHTNIARLYGTYKSDRILGYTRIYIPGVGTRFPEIGEDENSRLGSGCAFGCEGRVIFGLLAVLNALHYRALGQEMFDAATVRALCRNGANVTNADDRNNLIKFSATNGLLQTNSGGDKNRQDFLRTQTLSLETTIKSSKPRVVECFVDVFGFSRGAAEARVFCHWLDEILTDGRLAGVPLQFRFLGIMDTVASAGFWSGTSAMIRNSTGGHGTWANAESLRVPDSVQNCVHMVAMHELRRNFPLDEIGVNGKLQPGWIQHAYPGAHSDVGGGYCPGELGISVGHDSLKLSQIPLNHMFDCAIAAGCPLQKTVPIDGGFNPFEIHPDLLKAYDDFILQSTLAPRPIYEWLQPYLNWRWQVRDSFHSSNQIQRANPTEKEILLAFNRRLIDDAAAMTRYAARSVAGRSLSLITDAFFTSSRKDLITTTTLEPEAQEVFGLAKNSSPVPKAFSEFFDSYVHDSLAGFNSPKLELTGYWRYRKVFVGSDEYKIATTGIETPISTTV